MRKILKPLFSKKIISFLIFLVQILFILTTIDKLNPVFEYLYRFATFLSIVAILWEINRDVSPNFKIIWIALFAIFPLFGLFLYLYVHMDLLNFEIRRVINDINKRTKEYVKGMGDTLSAISEKEFEEYGIFKYLYNEANAPCFSNSDVTYFKVGEEMFKNLIKDVESAQIELKNLLIEKLNANKVEFEYPLIITIVGVNGVGKTTSIAKMTKYFQKEKKSVLLAAGDTFRAAATEQLNMWAERLKTKIVKQGEGADSAAVVFDAVHSMKAKDTDVLIVDTAGRLHTKTNLMKELEKINNVATREYPEAKRLNLIVLDASIGQNSIAQVKAFKDSVNIDGIILTKLDGTAKGGVVYPIINELKVPIIFTGFGETVDDLAVFDPESFVDKILM